MASEKSIETRVALLEKLIGRVFIELDDVRAAAKKTWVEPGKRYTIEYAVMQPGKFFDSLRYATTELGPGCNQEKTVSAPPAQTERVVDWRKVAEFLALEVARVTCSCPADSKDIWETLRSGHLSNDYCDEVCDATGDCVEKCWLEWAIQEVKRSCQSSE